MLGRSSFLELEITWLHNNVMKRSCRKSLTLHWNLIFIRIKLKKRALLSHYSLHTGHTHAVKCPTPPRATSFFALPISASDDPPLQHPRQFLTTHQRFCVHAPTVLHFQNPGLFLQCHLVRLCSHDMYDQSISSLPFRRTALFQRFCPSTSLLEVWDSLLFSLWLH